MPRQQTEAVTYDFHDVQKTLQAKINCQTKYPQFAMIKLLTEAGDANNHAVICWQVQYDPLSKTDIKGVNLDWTAPQASLPELVSILTCPRELVAHFQ